MLLVMLDESLCIKDCYEAIRFVIIYVMFEESKLCSRIKITCFLWGPLDNCIIYL